MVSDIVRRRIVYECTCLQPESERTLDLTFAGCAAKCMSNRTDLKRLVSEINTMANSDCEEDPR